MSIFSRYLLKNTLEISSSSIIPALPSRLGPLANCPLYLTVESPSLSFDIYMYLLSISRCLSLIYLRLDHSWAIPSPPKRLISGTMFLLQMLKRIPSFLLFLNLPPLSIKISPSSSPPSPRSPNFPDLPNFWNFGVSKTFAKQARPFSAPNYFAIFLRILTFMIFYLQRYPRHLPSPTLQNFQNLQSVAIQALQLSTQIVLHYFYKFLTFIKLPIFYL